MNFYHLTDIYFAPGDQLIAQPDGYCHWPENLALESLLERHRSADKLSRSTSVFFCGQVPRGDFGAAGDRYLVTCHGDHRWQQQRSDLNWLHELDQGFEDTGILLNDLSAARIEALANGYWSGRARPGFAPKFEFRATSARVECCELTEAAKERLEQCRQRDSESEVSL